MHKVEQSECSAGNQSQRRHALQTEEETTFHKDTSRQKEHQLHIPKASFEHNKRTN